MLDIIDKEYLTFRQRKYNNQKILYSPWPDPPPDLIF